jgi:hypothetical protein
MENGCSGATMLVLGALTGQTAGKGIIKKGRVHCDSASVLQRLEKLTGTY